MPLSLTKRSLTKRSLTQPLALGQRGERAAARFLKQHRYTILAGGWRTRYSEIDLIAVDHHGVGWFSRLRNKPYQRTLVFVEVKTRCSLQAGHPAEAVDANKQRRLSSAALGFLKANQLLEYPARFDVIAIVWPRGANRATSLEHFTNAFQPPDVGQFYV